MFDVSDPELKKALEGMVKGGAPPLEDGSYVLWGEHAKGFGEPANTPYRASVAHNLEQRLEIDASTIRFIKPVQETHAVLSPALTAAYADAISDVRPSGHDEAPAADSGGD